MIIEDSFSPALAQAFSESRMTPDIVRAVNTIMRDWVSFAIAKIPRADASKIKSRLEGRATRAKFDHAVDKPLKIRKDGSLGKQDLRFLQLRKSLAAYIVWATNYSDKGKKARTMTGQEFYAAVGRYIGRRQFSAGHHKGGLRPALNEFRARLGQAERLPRYRRVPGEARSATERDTIPWAEVSDWAGEILKVAPNAFSDSLPEIEAAVRRYIAENLQRRAEQAGLT